MDKLTFARVFGRTSAPRHVAGLMGVAVLFAACDGGALNPNSATLTAATPPTTVTFESYTLSGMVFEMTAAGQVPIEGVEIYCDSCGSPDGHTFVHTDANGFYSLAWAKNGLHPLLVTKAGYDTFDPTGTLRDGHGRITAGVQGDTRFDVQLVRR
jgi:hypothetical protein